MNQANLQSDVINADDCVFFLRNGGPSLFLNWYVSFHNWNRRIERRSGVLLHDLDKCEEPCGRIRQHVFEVEYNRANKPTFALPIKKKLV